MKEVIVTGCFALPFSSLRVYFGDFFLGGKAVSWPVSWAAGLRDGLCLGAGSNGSSGKANIFQLLLKKNHFLISESIPEKCWSFTML